MASSRRCPHTRIAGIYGDAIIYSAWYRLRCLDCGRLLDGPVSLATHEPGPPARIITRPIDLPTPPAEGDWTLDDTQAGGDCE